MRGLGRQARRLGEPPVKIIVAPGDAKYDADHGPLNRSCSLMKVGAVAELASWEPSAKRLAPRRLLAMALATSVASTSGTSFVYPILPVLASDLHVDPTEIGLAMAVLTMPGIVLAPLFGIIGDLKGRRRLLIFGLTLFGIGGAAAAATPSYG